MKAFTAGDITGPARWEITAMGLLVLTYVLAEAVFGHAVLGPLNAAGPLAFGLLLVAGAVSMTMRDRDCLWLGSFWFRLASAVYFGFGSFSVLFFNDYTRHQAEIFYWAQPAEIFRTNLICALSVFIFFCTSHAFNIWRPCTPPPAARPASDPMLLASAVIYCVLGYTIRFFFELPYSFNAFGARPLPGVVVNIVYLGVCGLFLLTMWCNTYNRRYLPVPALLLAFDMLAGTLQFAKTSVILPLIFFLLGLLRGRAGTGQLVLSAVAIWLAFATLVPVVQYGREQLLLRTGNIGIGSFTERMEILSNYVTGATGADPRADQQNTVARFYYSGAMAFAVTRHDRGNPGRSLESILTIFIPRSLWPDKPVYRLGNDFNLAVVGDDNSSTWMGIFAEAYWNFGWAGLPLVMVPMALLFQIMARASLDILRRGRWLHFPVVLIGIWMGMRVDSDIVQTQFVGPVFAALIYWGATVAQPLLLSFFAGRAGRA